MLRNHPRGTGSAVGSCGPTAGRSLHRLLFEVLGKVWIFLLSFSFLYFSPWRDECSRVVSEPAVLCANQMPVSGSCQVLLPLAGSCHELCLRGHFGKAEALLQSSVHPTAAPRPCQGTEAPQDPHFCSISQSSLRWDPPEPDAAVQPLPGGTDAFR